MTVSQPYANLPTVKKYCRSVGNIDDTIYGNILARADSEIEGALQLDVGEHIDNTYVYYGMIQNFCEQWSACQVHKMFGDPADALIFCDDAKDELQRIIIADTKLQDPEDIGNVEAPLAKTSPLNPDGHRLKGRPSSGDGQSFF